MNGVSCVTENGEGREGMDEFSERRLQVIDGERRRPRLASLLARVDAGEAGALEALERRIRVDYEDMVSCGRTRLADEAWGWALARVADVEAAEEFWEREAAGEPLASEAPGCWRGLRVRVSYAGVGGMQKPSSLAGRLDDTGQRGVLVLVDELEETRDGDDPASAGTIARRARSQRLVCWPALLTVVPLPIVAVGEEG